MKPACVRIWARPHASPHLRVAVVQRVAPASHCAKLVRSWAQDVLCDPADPPMVVAMMALWFCDDTGAPDCQAAIWSDHPRVLLQTIPDIAATYLRHRSTVRQARTEAVEMLGYTTSDDPDPAA